MAKKPTKAQIAAVMAELGRRGGKAAAGKGGKAAMGKLTAGQRTERARAAAKARWAAKKGTGTE